MQCRCNTPTAFQGVGNIRPTVVDLVIVAYSPGHGLSAHHALAEESKYDGPRHPRLGGIENAKALHLRDAKARAFLFNK